MEQSQDNAAIAQHQSLEQKMFSLIAEQQSSNMKIGPFCWFNKLGAQPFTVI